MDHTLVSGAGWNTYELTALVQDRITYSVFVTTPNACVNLFFVQGHDVGPGSEYFVTFSEEDCVPRYSNSFPVETADGTEFTVLLETNFAGNVDYSLTIDILEPAVPNWIAGLGIVVAIGLLPPVLWVTWRTLTGPRLPPLVPLRSSAGSGSSSGTSDPTKEPPAR